MFSLIENVCVPLPQCKSLNWMWRHRTEIPNETSENVEKFITSLKCGLPLDVCPQAKKIITRDRNPLVKGLRRNQGSFIRNPVKKLGYQKLVDYGCKPFLKWVSHQFMFEAIDWQITKFELEFFIARTIFEPTRMGCLLKPRASPFLMICKILATLEMARAQYC